MNENMSAVIWIRPFLVLRSGRLSHSPVILSVRRLKAVSVGDGIPLPPPRLEFERRVRDSRNFHRGLPMCNGIRGSLGISFCTVRICCRGCCRGAFGFDNTSQAVICCPNGWIKHDLNFLDCCPVCRQHLILLYQPILQQAGECRFQHERRQHCFVVEFCCRGG